MGSASRKITRSTLIVLATSILGGCFELGDPVDSDPSATSGTDPNDPPTVIVNSIPTISGIPSNVASVGTNWSFTPNAADADGDTLTFAIVNRPNWTNFDSTTGRLAGVPQLGQEGNYANIQITVSDGTSTANLASFSIDVSNNISNSAPTISGTAPTSVVVGQTYSFSPSATDADGDSLTFSIANRPNWAVFNSATGQLSGIPQQGDAAAYNNIVISVSDSQQSASLSSFAIVVLDAPVANRPPQISGTPSSVATIDQLYSFQPTASDADGDVLVFTISNPPPWTTFDTSSGQLSGTPTTGQEAVYGNIQILVGDGQATTALPAFSITVDNPNANDAPTISGIAPPVATTDQLYSFRPNASDADGDPLSFTISSQPSWTSFDVATGEITGTPSSSDVAIYGNIVITVSDGNLSTSLAPFSIAVEDPNSNEAPTISGIAAPEATVDQLYSFRPSAADADGDPLAFTISNQPSWTSFDPNTGEIAGTPLAGDVAVYSNIVITVSDGDLSASLAPFSITVSQTATGSVTLSWTPPTSNTDGTPLTDLMGYRIYYGTSPGTYPNEVPVNNPGLTTFVVENLSPNTYYFVSTSINDADVESDFSNEAVKTVN